MDSNLLIGINILGANLTVRMYDSILDNIETIMSIDYEKEVVLNVRTYDYLSLNSSDSKTIMEVDVSSRHTPEKFSLNYVNGTLCGINYTACSIDSIKNNLTVVDLESKIDLVGDRLDVMLMTAVPDYTYGKEYTGTYNELYEALMIKEYEAETRCSYILGNSADMNTDDMEYSSVSIIEKTDNSNTIKFRNRCQFDTVDIRLVEYIKLLVALYGENNNNV